MESLKQYLREYREIDNEIRTLNKELYEKREVRKNVEGGIIKIIAQPQFSEFSKLKLEDDGSLFKIQRPNNWQKPWALSKKDLQTLLSEYFGSTSTPNADDCYAFICEKRKNDLVATEFNFTRILPSEM